MMDPQKVPEMYNCHSEAKRMNLPLFTLTHPKGIGKRALTGRKGEIASGFALTMTASIFGFGDFLRVRHK
jgi:hypothetical protein